jgi:hypothetical protein
MKRSAIVASLLFLAAAVPARADIGPWSVAQRGMSGLLGSAFGPQGAVVVGSGGEIWSSSDNVTWVRRHNPMAGQLNGVVYGGGRFVAVGRTELFEPLVLVSIDGSTWTQSPALGPSPLTAIAYANGVYVAVGPSTQVLRATDPAGPWISWQLPAGTSLTAIAHGAGLFVAVGQGRRLVTSPDGTVWTDRSANLPLNVLQLRGITHTGSRFVAVGGGIATSTNGIQWSLAHNGSYTAVAASGSMVVAVNSLYGYATSPTGEQWTGRTLPDVAGVTPGAATVSFGGGRFLAAGASGGMRTSPDGLTWTNRTLPASRLFYSIAFDGTRFCATGRYDAAATSLDGVAWTNGATGPVGAGNATVWTGTRFVTVGPGLLSEADGAIATSPDCAQWTPAAWSLPPGTSIASFDDVAYAEGRLVAVGSQQLTTGGDMRPLIATSTDAVQWSAVASGFGTTDGWLRSVAHGDGRWVASGAVGKASVSTLMTTSTDGVTWTQVVAPGIAGTDVVQSIAHAGGMFVAVGTRIWTSADGLSWTARLPDDDFYHSVRRVNGQWVAVGQGGFGPGGVIAVSTDGISWAVSQPMERVLYAVGHSQGSPFLDRVVTAGDSVVLQANGGLPRVSFEAPSAPEASLDATLTLRLSAAAAVDVTVAYHTSDGVALAGLDYTAVQGVVTFPPGAIERAIGVPLVTDGLPEGDETFRLVMTQVAGAVLEQSEGVATIVDTPTITADDAAAPEGNAGASSAGLVVRMSHVSPQEVTVAFAPGGGTATPGVDYAAAAGTLTFAPGASVLPVPVSVLGDVAVEPDETFTLSLSSAANASVVDASADAVIQDDDAPSLAQRELAHGMLVREDFGAPAGVDVYRIAQAPRASYEVLVDAIAGDAVPVALERLAADNATVVGTGAPAGTGASVSLRWRNPASAAVANQHLRVRGACAAACGPDDVYRLRAYETTLRSPRFSNVGGQVTLLVLQNPAAAAVDGTAYFWSADGTLLQAHPLTLAPRQTLVVNAASLAGLVGRSGSVTVAHTAPYGVLAGKTVALEPATGFSFDTPLSARAR